MERGVSVLTNVDEFHPGKHNPGGSDGEESGDLGSIPGTGGSPGEGYGSPLQYSCLENTMDRGAWQATIHGVARVGHDLATKPTKVIHTLNKIFLVYIVV